MFRFGNASAGTLLKCIATSKWRLSANSSVGSVLNFCQSVTSFGKKERFNQGFLYRGVVLKMIFNNFAMLLCC